MQLLEPEWCVRSPIHLISRPSFCIDMVARAQKWSFEFMKNPVLTYEIDTMIETFKTSSLSFSSKIDSTNSRYTLLEDFLFNNLSLAFFN